VEDVVATLGLPQLTPLLVIVVFASVWVIQGIKRIVTMYVKGKWTQRIPPWSWWLLSVAVPVGIVYAFSIDWIQALLNASLPGDMSVTLPGYGEFATGVIASMSSNGVYAGLKKLGLTNDYKPGGPNDKSGPLDSQSENVVTQSGNVGQESQHISTSVGNFVPSGMGANGTTAGRPSGTGPDAGSIPAASTASLYMQAHLTPNAPYVVLTEDGKLYRIKQGQVEHLPTGWN